MKLKGSSAQVDFKRTGRESFADRISNWSDLAQLVEHFSRYSGVDWLFRGVSDEAYDLVPKVGRPRTTPLRTPKRNPYGLPDEQAVFRMFKQQGVAYAGGHSRTDLEWLALAQHYGVPTRLLDWTDNLLTAVWFATQDPFPHEKSCDAAVWVTWGVQTADPSHVPTPHAIETPQVFRPPHATPRMAAQGSVLMVCPQPTQAVAVAHKRKIVIDGKQRYHLRKRLNAAGVNERTLFPDLVGLGQHLDWLYQVNALTGYRKWSPDAVDESDE